MNLGIPIMWPMGPCSRLVGGCFHGDIPREDGGFKFCLKMPKLEVKLGIWYLRDSEMWHPEPTFENWWRDTTNIPCPTSGGAMCTNDVATDDGRRPTIVWNPQEYEEYLSKEEAICNFPCTVESIAHLVRNVHKEKGRKAKDNNHDDISPNIPFQSRQTTSLEHHLGTEDSASSIHHETALLSLLVFVARKKDIMKLK